MVDVVLPEEVLAHCAVGDVWVCVLGRVLDVSDLASPAGSLAARLLFAFAGKDLSHFFDGDTQDVSGRKGRRARRAITPARRVRGVAKVATFVHPVSGEAVAVAPFASLCLEGPTTPWWRDARRLRGRLTARSRPVRIVDTLSGLQVQLSVCVEDTLARVLQRYAAFNSAAARCECRHDGRPLDAARTLQENGVADERDAFAALGLPEDLHVPALLLHPLQDDDDNAPLRLE